jgi:type IV pilus assembly protein PilW
MLEARLAHDLHAAAERLHRSLRRAGSMAPGGLADGSAPNPYDVLTIGPQRGEVHLAASRDTVEDGRLDEGERFAFRVADGVLQMRLGAGTWQALTDASRLRVTRLDLRQQATPGCDGGRSVRHVHWAIAAEAVADPRARRTVEGSTRVRNDRIEWAPCPTSPAAS